MKINSDDMFESLIENDSSNTNDMKNISKVFEEKLEKGIAEIEKKMVETINKINVNQNAIPDETENADEQEETNESENEEKENEENE